MDKMLLDMFYSLREVGLLSFPIPMAENDENVTFLRSPSDDEKKTLEKIIKRCNLLKYQVTATRVDAPSLVYYNPHFREGGSA